MSARIRQIIAFLHLFLSLTTVVYSQQMGLNPMAKNYELPSLTINQTIQDQEGYIWFASTQGLSRYDSYNILNFKLRDAAGKVTSQQAIRTLVELENKLILGAEKGVYVLDKRNYKVVPLNDSRVASVRVNALMVDRAKRLWIGTDDGIFVYDNTLTPLTDRQSAHILNNRMRGKTVNTIFQDSHAQIWFGVWGAGLFKLSPGNNKLRSYPRLGQRNSPFKLMEDDHGQLWICTWGDGIYLFNPQQPNNPYQEIEIKNKRRHVGKEDLFYNIIQDRSRRYIWVLSFSGISTLQYQNGRLQEIDLSSYFDNTTNIFNDIYQDKYGTLWLAVGGEGVSMFSFDKPVVKNYSFK